MDCILEEGEMLYIPPRWWHYVRSLTTSFSVSFWWGDTVSSNAS
uniref:Transcription factor n=2 Tax=Rhizophora mucronata TaxID=61149 RepID=A0A2P2L7T1_RHIMU